MQLSLFDIPQKEKPKIEPLEVCCNEHLDKLNVSLTKIPALNLVELFEAYYNCRSNKRNTTNAIAFELDYESNLVQLCQDINNETYKIGRSIAFVVDKPVKREIFAADFRDYLKSNSFTIVMPAEREKGLILE